MMGETQKFRIVVHLAQAEASARDLDFLQGCLLEVGVSRTRLDAKGKAREVLRLSSAAGLTYLATRRLPRSMRLF